MPETFDVRKIGETQHLPQNPSLYRPMISQKPSKIKLHHRAPRTIHPPLLGPPLNLLESRKKTFPFRPGAEPIILFVPLQPGCLSQSVQEPRGLPLQAPDQGPDPVPQEGGGPVTGIRPVGNAPKPHIGQDLLPGELQQGADHLKPGAAGSRPSALRPDGPKSRGSGSPEKVHEKSLGLVVERMAGENKRTFPSAGGPRQDPVTQSTGGRLDPLAPATAIGPDWNADDADRDRPPSAFLPHETGVPPRGPTPKAVIDVHGIDPREPSGPVRQIEQRHRIRSAGAGNDRPRLAIGQTAQRGFKPRQKISGIEKTAGHRKARKGNSCHIKNGGVQNYRKRRTAFNTSVSERDSMQWGVFKQRRR